MKAHYDLFPGHTESAESILDQELPNLSSECIQWAERAAQGGFLNQCLQTIVRIGPAKTTHEALTQLNRIILGSKKGRDMLFSIDFSISSTRALRSLEKALLCRGKDAHFDNAAFLHGTISHGAVLRFESGEVFTAETVIVDEGHQRELFGKLVNQEHRWSSRTSKWSREGVIHRMAPLVALLTSHTTTSTRWMESVAMCDRLTEDLEGMLSLFFGGLVYKLPRGEDPYYRYLRSLTLLTWAMVLCEVDPRRSPRLLVKEIPVMPREFGLSGGRVDALEIKPTDGKWLCERKREEFLAGIAALSSYNLVHVIDLAHRVFGKTVQLVIIDKKFSVGDSGSRDILRASDVAEEALDKHIVQMQRYLMFAALGYYLTHKYGLSDPWTHGKTPSEGYIEYHVPDGDRVVHRIVATPDLLEETFRDRVVNGWGRGLENAGLRKTTSFITKEITGAQNGVRALINGTRAVQLEFQEIVRQNPIAELVSRYRTWVDPLHIFEQVRMDPPRYVLHVGNLIAAYERGEPIFDPSFNLDQGGYIRCPAPDHDDSDPSCKVFLKRGFFHCFSCGVNGRFARDSITESLHAVLPEISHIKRALRRTKNVIIGEDYYKIMASALRHLREIFAKDAVGRSYLINARGLDLDLATRYGVGYNDGTLVLRLLDEGYEWEEIVRCGFVGYSPRIFSGSSFVQSLKERLPLERIREIKGEGETQEVHYPYDILERRITFPLSSREGAIDNFYGRSVQTQNKRFKHRKLSVAKTGVPHGPFNVGALSGSSTEVLVVESCLDALALIQLGKQNVVAVIGLYNVYILETFLNSGKNLHFALNNDARGHDAAEKAVRRLERMGSRVPVRNFTRAFNTAYPDLPEYDDWNTLLQRVQDLGETKVHQLTGYFREFK